MLRCEYRPGSTRFVVWNMEKEDAARPGTFSALRDIRDTFRGSGTHVFMIKMNIWMGL